jgi:prepilin-type N-terminal cleavage/methylation domain-containing protein
MSTCGRSSAAGPARGGFSLIEIVVVVAIVGVLVTAAVAGFNLSRTPRMLALAAAQVAADLRATQDRARVESATYAITFVVGGREYTIARPDAARVDRLQLPRGTVIASTTWPDHRLEYSGFGVPRATGVVRLQNRSGVREVIVEASGRVATP